MLEADRYIGLWGHRLLVGNLAAVVLAGWTLLYIVLTAYASRRTWARNSILWLGLTYLALIVLGASILYSPWYFWIGIAFVLGPIVFGPLISIARWRFDQLERANGKESQAAEVYRKRPVLSFFQSMASPGRAHIPFILAILGLIWLTSRTAAYGKWAAVIFSIAALALGLNWLRANVYGQVAWHNQARDLKPLLWALTGVILASLVLLLIYVTET